MAAQSNNGHLGNLKYIWDNSILQTRTDTCKYVSLSTSYYDVRHSNTVRRIVNFQLRHAYIIFWMTVWHPLCLFTSKKRRAHRGILFTFIIIQLRGTNLSNIQDILWRRHAYFRALVPSFEEIWRLHFLGAFVKISKSDYYLRHVCLPVCPSVRPTAWIN